MANLKFERYTIPRAEEVYQARIVNFIEQITNDVDETKLIPFKNEWVWPLMQMDKEKLVEIILHSEMKNSIPIIFQCQILMWKKN